MREHAVSESLAWWRRAQVEVLFALAISFSSVPFLSQLSALTRPLSTASGDAPRESSRDSEETSTRS